MRYCGGYKIEDIWDLTIPQLNYLLKQINEHVEFTIKCHSLSFGGLFGGVVTGDKAEAQSAPQGVETTDAEGNTYVDGYKVADAEDMNWLASIL